MEKDVPVKSLKKALDLLSILLFQDPEEKGFSVKTLAEKLGLPANSVHNLLKTMAVCGYVEKNGEGRYTCGNVCRRIAFKNYQTGNGFRDRVIDIMRRAIARINQAMVFCILGNNVWASLVKAGPAGRIVKVDMEQVERFYLYETATGRILYSFSSPEKRAVLLRENGTPDAFWPDFEKDSLRIREQGECSLMRTRYGVFSFAVPVFDHDHNLLGALGIYCLPQSCSAERNQFLLENLKLAAKEISGI